MSASGEENLNKRITLDDLELFAQNDTKAFSRMRNTLRATGDMFLFGKPTKDILFIMMKLYHENLARIAAYTDRDTYIYKSHPANPGGDRIQAPVNFMCGIIEMKSVGGEKPQIYITISEAPKLGDVASENINFDKKERTLISLLEHCNISVKYPEGANFKQPEGVLRWRTFDNLTPSELLFKREAYDNLKENMLINLDDYKSSINYENSIWSTPYEVNVINSYDYLKRRLNGVSFPPYKKYNANKPPTGKIECNNGSTCTESKLFSYVHNVLKKKFDDIKGFAVFWVGNKLPPNHHLASYCYSPSNGSENTKLNAMTDTCIDIFDNAGNLKSKYEAGGVFHKIMKQVVQPIAMACPGCYSNYNNYINGTYSEWDKKGCYKPINSRLSRRLARARGSSGGYKKTRRERVNKNKKYNH